LNQVWSSNSRISIETFALTKYYGRRRGIADLFLQVPRGSIFGFLGPNGAGKTTTIRLLLGFLRPSVGTAVVNGCDIIRHSPHIRRMVGYLPGEVRLFNHLTGAKILRFLAGLRGQQDLTHASRLASALDLDLSVKVRNYSRGMRQKLGLIQAMMHRPNLLILDEPTNSLDPLVQQTVYELLEQFAREGGTVFFSSHIISEVERICDQVAIVRNGRLVANDTVEKLRRKSLQHVRLVLGGDCRLPQPLPDDLQMIQSQDRQAYFTWKGPMDGLIKYLSAVDVEHLTIEPPSLEEVFLEFYQDNVARNNHN